MSKEAKTGDDKKPNLLVLQEFRLKGSAVPKGAIVKKTDFPNKSDYLNLMNMAKPRVEETDEKVRDKAPAGKDVAKAPGA